MSGIVGSYFNTRGSGVVAKLGTDGQVFTSAGAGLSQGFEAAAGGGATTFINRTTISGDPATLTVSGVFSSTYDNYIVFVDDVFMSAPADVYIQWVDASRVEASGYKWTAFGRKLVGSTSTDLPYQGYGGSGTNCKMNSSASSSLAQHTAAQNGVLNFYNVNSPSGGYNDICMSWEWNHLIGTSDDGEWTRGVCSYRDYADALTGFKLSSSTGTFSSGSFTTIGINKS